MNKLDAFIQHAVSSVPVSGTSLISSLYGDALSHRGGEIWLGSLAALLEGMGFGERFVRTALFRLNKEGWLDVSRIGRRSFYRLSDKGLRLTRRAENKIYRAELPAWDGKWLLLLSEGLNKTTLADVKKQLIWQGFGTLAPSLMASPSQIHFYRRVVLKDPLLPEELLPAHWAGQSARQLCINIYQRVAPGALAFVSEKGETSVGELPVPGTLYYQRFGGLTSA